MFITKIPPEPPKAASPQPNKATMQKACKRSQTNCCYHVNKKLLLCLTSFSLAGRYFSYWKSLKPAPNTTVNFFFSFLKGLWVMVFSVREGSGLCRGCLSVCLSVRQQRSHMYNTALKSTSRPLAASRTYKYRTFFYLFFSFPLSVWLLFSFFSFSFFLQVLYII